MNKLDCRTVLAFFAHPDDEILAAGATLSKLCANGTEVSVAFAATGIHSRRNTIDQGTRDDQLASLRRDSEAALQIIGVPSSRVYFGEFSDNQLDESPRLELIHWLENLVGRIEPEAIFTHHRFCTNIDHQYCHEAAVVATRPAPGHRIDLFAGEIPSSTGYLRPTQWEPNLYISVSEEELTKKIEAMECYTGEARPAPHPRSADVLRSLAVLRGSEAGVRAAEAFMCQRVLVD